MTGAGQDAETGSLEQGRGRQAGAAAGETAWRFLEKPYNPVTPRLRVYLKDVKPSCHRGIRTRVHCGGLVIHRGQDWGPPERPLMP